MKATWDACALVFPWGCLSQWDRDLSLTSSLPPTLTPHFWTMFSLPAHSNLFTEIHKLCGLQIFHFLSNCKWEPKVQAQCRTYGRQFQQLPSMQHGNYPSISISVAHENTWIFFSNINIIHFYSLYCTS